MKRQQGVGIVEVLVALVVVSLGVLGMASLQLTGMQHSTGGLNRSKALLYAENTATRMRTNRPAVRSQMFDGFDSGDLSCNARPAPYCQASAAGAAERCDVAELVEFDLFSVSCGDWGPNGAEDGVLGSLPNGQLTIDCDTDTGPCVETSNYTITVSWTEGQRVTSDMNDTVRRRVQMRMKP